MTPTQAVRTMYEHAARGEWAAVQIFMAQDFVIHEPASLPYGGEWRGRDALERLFIRVMSFWRDPLVEWIDLIGGETHVVALLRFSMTVPETGERIVQHVSEVTRFDGDGKMAEMRIHYFDTAAMARALKA
ncbi:nuclear transport factor 2 family protein [Sphingobium sp. Sx8-8]|uniref:nuclear transport factor 2 family protein n=1 Tax=Sphingobium sp. Sx8-8 TaxID=2933617 RepID=UPI001F59E0B4|nr:nuclear transport factor 2 family protein [Sphingobium sp. Sx8-8]